MPSVYDIKPSVIIQKAAEALEKDMKMPEWAYFVKTSPASQRHPIQKNWYFLRAASILLKIYKKGPVGTSKLRTVYSKKKNRGYQPAKTYRASGKIIRSILQQLEKAAYIEQGKKGAHKGRMIAKKGRDFLHGIAKQTAS